MTKHQAREAARDILRVVPLVMRTVAAQLRASGELPAPAHFPLLSLLSTQPRTLSELASLQGVSLPTMSNSITAMVRRGWVQRIAQKGAGSDRRVVVIDVTPDGRTALSRVGKCAEGHIAGVLGPLTGEERRKLQDGLDVLRRVFAASPYAPPFPNGKPRSRRAKAE